MFDGTFALLERSLRIDLRGRATHLVRLGLMAAIYFALCTIIAEQVVFGAPGLYFLSSIAYLDAVFVTLLGIGFFSSVITEEKEEDTLGLMLMAGISPLGILLGKSGGTLTQALLLVAIQYPFMLLAITMGGVSHLQVWAVTVALLAFILFMAGFGLLCSTIAPRNRTAATLVTIGLILYLAVPGMAQWMTWRHLQLLVNTRRTNETSVFWTLLETIGSVSIYLELGRILSTGFGQSAFSFQVISNSLAGLIALGLSWLFFGLATRSLSTEAHSRGLVPRRRAFLRFPAGRSWTNPFVWKDFHFVSGGLGSMLLRSIYFVGLGTAVFLFEVFFEPGWAAGEWIEPCLVFMSFSVSVDAGLVLARSLHDEVRGQTLASLMMLPRSSIAMVYTKFAGAMLGWLPGPIIELIFAGTSERGQRDLWILITNQYDSSSVIMWFVMLPHIAALVSLYVRWGAVPVAIGLSIGGTIFVQIMHGICFPGMDYYFFAVLNTVLMVLICIVCHIGVLLRIQALGAR